MNAWLRQHRYALAVTLRRLSAQPFSSLLNLLVMALALALPLLGVAMLVSVEPITRHVSVTPEITIFLKQEAPAQAAGELAARIRKEYAQQVRAVRTITRDEALASLRSNPAWKQAFAVLLDNPLPDAVVATLTEGANLADRANRLAQSWQQWNDVDWVQLDSAWVQRLEAILRFVRIGLFFLAGWVVVIVVTTIFNTVRLQATSQQEEIAVARLVGATESFVRRPFLYLGALSGAMAALLAIGIAALALTPLNTALLALARSYGQEFALHLPSMPVLLIAVLAAAALGGLSARWSVGHHSRA
jgi:cell division transport system permease protein